MILRDLTNLNDPIECTITAVTVPGYPNDGWMIEIDNYANVFGDGWLIIDFDIKNPVLPSWTKAWRVCTY